MNEFLKSVRMKLGLTSDVIFSARSEFGVFSIINFTEDDLYKIEISSQVRDYHVVSFFLNFNLTDVYNVDFSPLIEVKKDRIIFETSSFNPTGIPHLGNLHIFIHGSVLKRMYSVVSLKVVHMYFINDQGGQILKLMESIFGTSSIYDTSHLKELKGLPKDEVVDFFMKGILDKMRRYDDLPDIFVKESYMKFWRSKFMNEVKKYIEERDGASFLKEGVLLKADREHTYMLTDLALQSFLTGKGFDASVVVMGADHATHAERMFDLSNDYISRNFYRPIVLGKISLESKEGIMKLSKRRSLATSNFNDLTDNQLRLLSLALSGKKDIVISPRQISRIVNQWDLIFRIRLRIRSLAVIEGNDWTVVRWTSYLREIFFKSLRTGDIHYLFNFWYSMSQDLDLKGRFGLSPSNKIFLMRTYAFLNGLFKVY